MVDSRWNRLAAISELVERGDPSRMGRTALMKFLYLLKEVRGVPLDYRFTLYTYGPFDSAVLDDLSYAEALDAVESELVYYPGGYGYEFKPGQENGNIREKAKDFLFEYADDFDWVVRAFGGRRAGELEMVGTIVYVARSCSARGEEVSPDEVASKVVEIKPYLDFGIVRCEAEQLREAGYL